MRQQTRRTSLSDFAPETKEPKSRGFWLIPLGGMLVGGFWANYFVDSLSGSESPTETVESNLRQTPPEGLSALMDDIERDEQERLARKDEAPSPAQAEPAPLPQPEVVTTSTQEDGPFEFSGGAEAEEEVAQGVEFAKDGAFYVQVESYQVKEIAERRAEEFSARGLKAQTMAYGGPAAGWWHAVRLGPFETRVDAERQRFQLSLNERRGAHVLPRSNGGYHVQVASLQDRDKAKAVAARYEAQGHVTKISRVKMQGTRWHCVRIGPFDTREEAMGYQSFVKDEPGLASTVVPFGPPPQATALLGKK